MKWVCLLLGPAAGDADPQRAGACLGEAWARISPSQGRDGLSEAQGLNLPAPPASSAVRPSEELVGAEARGLELAWFKSRCVNSASMVLTVR